MTWKAGDAITIPIYLEQLGVGGVTYANLAAANAAGWAWGFWQGAAVLASPPAISLTPMATAPAGWHVLGFAIPTGVDQLLTTTPAGYQASWDAAELIAGLADDDLVYNAILATVGVPQPAGQLTASASYKTTEGDGFWQQITVPAGLLTPFGYADLSAAGWTVSGAVRDQTDTGTGAPAAVLQGFVFDGASRIIQFGWGAAYPSGLALNATDIGNGGKTWNYDVQIKLPIATPVAAVVVGAGGSFKLTGDKRNLFDTSTSFTVTGSTGNNGTYTPTAIAYTGGQTVLTVANVPSAVADGNVNMTLVLTAQSGQVTTARQIDRT